MWKIQNAAIESRLLLGTAGYPSLAIMRESVIESAAEVITVSLKRQSISKDSGTAFWDAIKDLQCHVLPNTAGCRSAKEAIMLAHMAREVFNTPWIKLEVIGDDYNLAPNPYELIIAAKELIAEGFVVLPYCTDDLIVCQRLRDIGCEILMPWAAPIGSGLGIVNPYQLRMLRERLRDCTLIIDAGIGAPSHATLAMEMGFDAVLLNSAVALAEDPIQMASAFKHAIIAGRKAYLSGVMPQRDFARPSTPLIDTPFWMDAETK